MQTLNEVKVNQIWKDLAKEMHGRLIQITSVEREFVHGINLESGHLCKIGLTRFFDLPGRKRAFQLIQN